MTITAERADGDANQAAEQVRTCAYQQCGQPLPYDGRGRPPEYCADRRWAQGRSCKQMAAADRAAERASGLEVPLETFRTAGERLVNVASPLARQLTELVTAIQHVQDGALSRIAGAEQSAAEAYERAQSAESRAQRAERDRQAAEAERQRAREAAEEAQRQSKQARQEADEATRRAGQQVAEADHARGRAEAGAQAAERSLAQEVELRRAAEQRAADIDAELRIVRERGEAELRGLRERLEAERATLVQVRDDLAATTTRADAAEADAAKWRGQTQSMQDELAGRLAEREEAGQRAADAEMRHESAVAEVQRMRTEANRLAVDVDRLREALAAESQRADRAEARVDKLIASLGTDL